MNYTSAEPKCATDINVAGSLESLADSLATAFIIIQDAVVCCAWPQEAPALEEDQHGLMYRHDCSTPLHLGGLPNHVSFGMLT